MRIGYACNNLTLKMSASRTFRLASYTPDRLLETVDANLDALQTYLEWNRANGISYFRISSGMIPFASHHVMDVDWRVLRADRLADVGAFLQSNGMRVNMHPGQYTLLNSPRPEVVANSVAELAYHADLLDAMNLDQTHRIQLHVGGVYGDKPAAMDRFVQGWGALPANVRARLVIENDDRHYSLADCLQIHARTGIPVLFDTFHHALLNSGEPLTEAFDLAFESWPTGETPMLDYSSQDTSKRPGAHAATIDADDFLEFLETLGDRDADVMLEIKDKETSALRANELVASHR